MRWACLSRLTLSTGPAAFVAAARAVFLLLTIGVLTAGNVWGSESPRPTFGDVQVTEIATGLEHPWALAFMPDGSMLVTERPGRLRRLTPEGELSPPIDGVPEVAARGQGGLLEVLLSPDFDTDRFVYLSYAESDGRRSGTAVGRGRLSADATRLEDFVVLFRQTPKLSTGHHFGGRMVFGTDGMLYIAVGESNQRPTAQDLDKHQGTIVRIRPDGTVPADNPFVRQQGALPEIWSYGHRNPQGLAVNPWTGDLWEHEHGPRGGDEVNIIRAGLNYGWPRATYGVNYSGFAIPEAEGAQLEGMEPPLMWWRKSPAVSGMAFYDNERFKEWAGSLFVGALAQRVLIRLVLDGDRIVAEERLLRERNDRIRDVRQGPDGFVYVLTDAQRGALLRLHPAGADQ